LTDLVKSNMSGGARGFPQSAGGAMHTCIVAPDILRCHHGKRLKPVPVRQIDREEVAATRQTMPPC